MKNVEPAEVFWLRVCRQRLHIQALTWLLS